MSIKIISIGKKHESWVVDGIAMYEKRLRKPFEVSWQIVPHSNTQEKAIEDESSRILDACKPDDFVIVLDEDGQNIDTPQLSQKLQEQFNWSTQVVFVIGGAYGVTTQVLDRADFVWSFSKLVFPHQLMRLMLVEQIYRAQSIAAGDPYHHG